MRAMPSRLLALTVLTLSFAGCIITEPPPPPPDPFGDISFDWQFAGEPSCDDAGVDEVDLTLLRAGQVVLVIEREPCVGGGLTLTDIHEGTYEVIIDAFSRDSELLYAGSFAVAVEGGVDNYAGVIDLDPVNPPPPPPPADGELRFFWAFQYPGDGDVLVECGRAGAEEVDIFLTDLSGAPVFEDTRFCEDDGVSIAPLPQGSYQLRLMAYGSYHGDDLLLYDSGALVVDVVGDATNDLGDVALPRIDNNFADFDVAWTFAADTCASTGVATVNLAIRRLEEEQPEDSLAVDCSASNIVRRTFVPGSYEVTATADGASADFLGSVTVDVPPNSVAQIDLVLAPL
jgi:hypothetical protein